MEQPPEEISISLEKEAETFETEPHPFDTQELKEFVQEHFSEYTDSISECKRPGLSNNPDDMEKWEAQRIRQRKQRFKNETLTGWLNRILYEETFLVDPFPGRTDIDLKQGIPGFTPGGLISHHYILGSSNSRNIEDVLDLSTEESLKEQLLSLPDRKSQLNFLDVVSNSTYRRTSGSRLYLPLVLRNIQENKGFPRELDSTGYRLLRILQARKEEFYSPVKDPKLKECVKASDRELNKIDLLYSAWARFQSLLTKQGGIRSLMSEELKSDLEDFLFFRTHPETQIFYEYLSPSGFLNEQS